MNAITHRTITIPPVTAALLAHGVTDWSTHDFRGSVRVGDRGIIVAGAGPVRSEDVPEGWWLRCHRDGSHDMFRDLREEPIPVVTRAARAVGTVAEVVPIYNESDWTEDQQSDPAIIHTSKRPPPFRVPELVAFCGKDSNGTDISHLLPFADWSPTTASGRQRWAVRWEDMRIIEPAVELFFRIAPPRESPVIPVPLHRGWRVADPGLIAAVGEDHDD